MDKILKTSVMLLLLMIALGCSKKEENLEDEKKLIEYIRVEGVCREDHTNVQEEYSGSIVHWHNITKDTHARYGSVDRELDTDEVSVKNQYKYFPPFMIELSDLKPEDLVGDELHLKGTSGRLDSPKSYEATCTLKVVKRLDHLPSDEEEKECKKKDAIE